MSGVQSKRHSAFESLVNTFSAFLLSVAVYQFVLPPVWGIHVPLIPNLGITGLFTVLSLGRNYLCRRLFNRRV